MDFLNSTGLATLWSRINLLVSTEVAKLSRVYAAIVHTHVISNVVGLQDALASKATIASPIFTGTPKAPTASIASTESTQIATIGFVSTYVSNAIGQLSSIEYKVVASLPPVAEASSRYIYFVQSGSTSGSKYKEYFFISVSDQSSAQYPGYYELVGDVALDLSNYWNSTNLRAMTIAEIDTIMNAELEDE